MSDYKPYQIEAVVTCPKRAQTEPTDAQVEAGVRALYEYAGLEVYPDEMRVVLKAAFAAGQEEQS